jgi:hypothetical protein
VDAGFRAPSPVVSCHHFPACTRRHSSFLFLPFVFRESNRVQFRFRFRIQTGFSGGVSSWAETVTPYAGREPGNRKGVENKLQFCRDGMKSSPRSCFCILPVRFSPSNNASLLQHTLPHVRVLNVPMLWSHTYASLFCCVAGFIKLDRHLRMGIRSSH